jgi:hypothetical protein
MMRVDGGIPIEGLRIAASLASSLLCDFALSLVNFRLDD